MCTGVEGPNRVFTNTIHGSDSSKAQTKKAKDSEKSSKPSSAFGANLKADDGKHRATSMKKKNSKSEGLGPVPTFRDYPFDEIPGGTCDSSCEQCYKSLPLKSHDIKNQAKAICYILV